MPTTTSPPILLWQPGGGVPVGPVSNPPVYSQADVTPLLIGQAYVDVVFGSTQTTPDWVLVECEVVNTTDGAPLNIWPGIMTSKLTTGFRLYLNGLPDSGNYYLHWAVSGVNIPPPAPFPATTYTLTGPSSGIISIASTNFTVKLPLGSTVASPVMVTPSDGGVGGTFTPTSVALTTAAPSATFTYTPSTYGSRSITTTNDGGLIDPFNLTYTSVASTYTLSGPSTGASGVPSTNFTVALPAGGWVIGSVTVTPNDSSGGGTFAPTTVNLSTAGPSATFTYTPATSGAKTISVTNNGALTDPGSLTYTVAAFDPTTITGLKLWLKADGIAGPPADGTLLSAWNDSSGTGYNLGNAGGSERPTFKTAIVNGKPVVRFDGVANRMFSTSTPAAITSSTIFVVGNQTTLNDCRWFHSSVSVVLFGMDAAAGYIEMYAGGAGFMHAASTTDQHGGFHQWTAVFNGALSRLYSDGSLIASGDPGSNSIGRVGVMTDGDVNSTHSAGDVAEILVYNFDMGATDRVNVENYLKGKFNTP